MYTLVQSIKKNYAAYTTFALSVSIINNMSYVQHATQNSYQNTPIMHRLCVVSKKEIYLERFQNFINTSVGALLSKSRTELIQRNPLNAELVQVSNNSQVGDFSLNVNR